MSVLNYLPSMAHVPKCLTRLRAHVYVPVCLYFVGAFIFLRALRTFIFFYMLSFFTCLHVIYVYILINANKLMNLSMIVYLCYIEFSYLSQLPSPLLYKVHFYKTFFHILYDFSFFETKNISYFWCWTEHLTYWKTGTLSETRNSRNIKFFYSKAYQENIHSDIWLNLIPQYCLEWFWLL